MKYFCSIVLLLTAWITAFAQSASEPQKLSADSTQIAAKTITDTYTSWTQVSISGKAKIQGLPISPSFKLFMKNGESIVLSLRVPLMGEVGTLEVTENEFTIINKLKKTYCSRNISELTANLPISLSDLQDIFLARIFLPDCGTLSMDNYTSAEFYTVSTEPGWIVLPSRQPTEYNVSCGYTALPDGRTGNIFVTSLNGQDQAAADYNYSNKDVKVDIRIRYNSKDRDFSFSMKEPDFNGKPIYPAEITDDYKEVSLKDFFKSML